MTSSDNINKVKNALLSMQRHSWEQGVAMQAFLELGDMNVVIAMAKEAAYRCLPDGRLAVLDDSSASTDPCSVGEALHAATQETNDPSLILAHKNLLLWALEKAPSNGKGIVYHFDNLTQFWIDSMYMLPPFLADAGYYQESIKQIDGYWTALYHPQRKMMSHMWDDDSQTYVREAIWGGGNGWTLAGITRVIEKLPDEFAEDKIRMQERVISLLDNILTYMEPNGMFHDVVDDPNTFLEINLSQMVAYTIFRCMRAGWLSNSYLPIAKQLREAANTQVDCYGFVQNACGAPHFDKVGISPEAQAFYLLMEAAVDAYYSQTGKEK